MSSSLQCVSRSWFFVFVMLLMKVVSDSSSYQSYSWMYTVQKLCENLLAEWKQWDDMLQKQMHACIWLSHCCFHIKSREILEVKVIHKKYVVNELIHLTTQFLTIACQKPSHHSPYWYVRPWPGCWLVACAQVYCCTTTNAKVRELLNWNTLLRVIRELMTIFTGNTKFIESNAKWIKDVEDLLDINILLWYVYWLHKC